MWSYREIVEALLYLLRGGLPWRMLPPEVFPPMTTVQHYFYRWRDIGLWPSIDHALLMTAREQVGREASPSAGDKLATALAKACPGPRSGVGKWTLEIIRRSDTAKGFELLPRRRVVERTFAWLGRNRRLAKDFERTLQSATPWLYMASVQLLMRRIASH